MGTKKETTTTNQYDPGSKGVFDQLTPRVGNTLQAYMSNPFGNAQYRLGLGASMASANAQGMNAQRAMQSQIRTSGMSGGAGNAFQMAQMGRIGRYASGLRSQATLQNIQSAFGRQQWATQLGAGYQPLQTGQNAVQKTSGLGTWLPQTIGMAAGVAMAPFTGGASLLGAAGNLGKMGGGDNLPIFNSQMAGVNSGIDWGNLAQGPGTTSSGFNPFAFQH